MDNAIECERTDKTNTLLANIKNTIIRYYEKSGLRQKAITRWTGIKRAPLSLLLCGKRSIYADELLLLIVVLDIPLPEVFGPDLWREYKCRMSAKEMKII